MGHWPIGMGRGRVQEKISIDNNGERRNGAGLGPIGTAGGVVCCPRGKKTKRDSPTASKQEAAGVETQLKYKI